MLAEKAKGIFCSAFDIICPMEHQEPFDIWPGVYRIQHNSIQAQSETSGQFNIMIAMTLK